MPRSRWSSRRPRSPFTSRAITGPTIAIPTTAVYDAITDIFSNGRTARLYRSLVRDQQIAAEAEGFSGFPGQKYPRALRVLRRARCPGTRRTRCATSIHKEMDKLKNADVTDEELQRYKTRAKADLLRGLADNEGLAHQLAEYQTRFGDWRELFNQLKKVDAVTKADVRRVANKVFVESNRTSARIEFTPPRATQGREERRRCGMKILRRTALM